MTDKLESLLRKLVEVYPDKFKIVDFDYLHWNDACTDLTDLADPIMFSLDDMDTMALMLGMLFQVSYDFVDESWGYDFYLAGVKLDCIDGCGGFKSKREASLAALCSILTYKLGEGK